MKEGSTPTVQPGGNTSDLFAALVDFQGNMPAIEKRRVANIPTKSGGSYSYKYADLADIWEAVRDPLKKAGLGAIQLLDGGADGTTRLTTTIIHTSGQSISSTMDLSTGSKTPQEAGSLFTYYKRYALGAALGISTEEDDDGKAGNAKPPAKVAKKTNPAPSETQLKKIGSLLDSLEASKEARAQTLLKADTYASASKLISALELKLHATEETA